MQNTMGHWQGLNFELVEREGACRVRDHQMANGVLVLHLLSGRQFGVQKGRTVRHYQAELGCLDYYPAGDYDTLSAGLAPWRGVAVDIPPTFEASVLDEGHLSDRALPPRFQFRDARLARLVSSMAQSSQRGFTQAESIIISVALVEYLHELITSRNGSSTFSRVLRRLLNEYLDDHVHSTIDLDRLALLTGLPRAQFGHVFRTTFASTPHKYFVAHRIAVARQRLAQGAAVGDVAYALGFSSHAHFSTVFLKATGMTPSKFRLEATSNLNSHRGA